MMSEADPALLAELCSALLGEEEEVRHEENAAPGGVRARSSATKTTKITPTSSRTLPSGAAGGRRRVTALGPLQRRDQNSMGENHMNRQALRATTPTLKAQSAAAVGKGASCAVWGSTAAAAASRGSAAGVAGLKGRRMCTPTKASVGSRLPERKSTRMVSPQKNGGGGGSQIGGESKKELSLSKDQQRAVDLVLEGKSIFFTGERYCAIFYLRIL